MSLSYRCQDTLVMHNAGIEGFKAVVHTKNMNGLMTLTHIMHTYTCIMSDVLGVHTTIL